RVKQYMQGPEKAAGSEIGDDKKIPGLGQVLSAAFWDDPTDVELLQEPVLSWHLARPGLFLAALLMVGLTTILCIVGIWSIVDFTHSTLGSLLLITSLATGAYALFTWSSYTAHDRYIALLGPFIRSTNLRHWLNTDLQRTEQGLEDLFFHLCQDVLAVKFARMTVMAGSVRRIFSYRWPLEAKEQFMYTVPAFAPGNGIDEMSDRGNRAPARVSINIDGQP